jgi:hypothetical protein
MRGARKNAQGRPTQPPPHGASADTPARRRSRKRHRTDYGEYVGIVTAKLPNDVRNLALAPGESAVVDREEVSTLLVGVNVNLLPGTKKQVVFYF